MTTEEIKALIVAHHYAHSWPSGKSWIYDYEGAIVVFSIPANNNTSRWLVGESNRVLELTRLWAPDGHSENLLTQAISHAVALLKVDAPQYTALVSYADPNTQCVEGVDKPSHHGGVYLAASWHYMGRSEEGRFFRHSTTGQIVPRRKFHMGKKFLRDPEIVALGYVKENQPGKHRFARGLTRQSRRLVANHPSAQ